MKGDGFDLDMASIFARPDLYLHDIDVVNMRAEFIRMSRDGYAGAWASEMPLFAPQGTATTVDIAEIGTFLESRQPPVRRLHFIFHTGHAGSLRIARLLGTADGLFPLREPPAVRLLSWESRFLGTARARVTGAEWRRLREIVLRLSGRTWNATDTALIRTNSHCTRIMRPLLDWYPGSRAILLHVGLQRFLRTMLQPNRRAEIARYVSDLFYYDLQRILGDARPRIDSLPQSKRTALVWLIHMHEFGRLMMESNYSARVLLVDFDNFLDQRERMIGDICGFLGVPRAGRALAAEPDLGAIDDGDEVTLHPVMRAEIYDAMQWAAVMRSRMAGSTG